MFRQVALRKGHLKVIKAYEGTYLPMDPKTSTPKGPGFFSKLKADAGGIGRNIKDPRFLIKAPFGMGGGLTRTAGSFGLYPLISEGTRKLGMQGVGKDVADLGIAAALSRNPYTVGAGLLYGGYRASRPLVGRLTDLVKERPLGTTASNPSFMPGVDGLLGKPINQTSLEDMIKNNPKGRSISKPGNRQSIASGRGAGDKKTAVGYTEFDDAVAGKDKLMAQENKSDLDKGVIDIDKVVKNVAPVPPGGDGGITADAPIPEKKKDVKVAKVEDDAKTDEKANEKIVNKPIVDGAAGKVTAGDGTPVTDNVIQRAKEIRRELMAGQSSQAKLVFLANLASGLMSGTTAKAGIGGALEVFGRALGPAVNNYAAIKLKENELENEFMSDALELASDEFEARNSILEAPDVGKTTAGIIQFTDANGTVKNMSARQLEDSTIQIAVPGKTDEYGRQLFQTVPVGTFDRFVTTKYATKEQGVTLRNLSGKYKAYGLGKKTIDILRDAEAMDKKFGGPAGRLNLVTGRLGDAFSDLGLSFATNKESGFEKIDEIKDGMVKDLMADGMKEDEARKFLEDRFGSTKRMFQDNLKSMGVFKDESDQANLERLAINETILTYALANSLKDKDRLTQKDIQMAKELVNIFPLLRGQKTVIKSLEAVNETILGDIERLENDYQFSFFGDSSTINNYRMKYGLLQPGQDSNPLPNYYKDTDTQQLLEDF